MSARTQPRARHRTTMRAAVVTAMIGTTLGLSMPTASAQTHAAASGQRAVIPMAAQCSDGKGALIPSAPPALATLQSTLAWSRSEGEGVVVAIIDSGVDSKNPHLKGTLAGGTDLVGDGAGQSGYADTNGHGTALAGQIVAASIQGSGIQGLAPKARILSVRVYAGTSDEQVKNGFGPSIARTAAGITYAADHRAQIINVSMDTPDDNPTMKAAVAYASSRGSLVVASAGNRGQSEPENAAKDDGNRYPAAYPGALGVAAAGENQVADSASLHGSFVGVTAPGTSVLTSATAGIDCNYPGEQAAPATSYATAYVSAAAALVASAYPQESPSQWAYRLQATAIRASAAHRDNVNGWGFIQPFDALNLAPGANLPGPQNPFTASGSTAQVHGPAQNVVVAEGDRTRDQQLQATLLAVLGGAVVMGVVGALAAGQRRRAQSAVIDRKEGN